MTNKHAVWNWAPINRVTEAVRRKQFPSETEYSVAISAGSSLPLPTMVGFSYLRPKARQLSGYVHTDNLPKQYILDNPDTDIASLSYALTTRGPTHPARCVYRRLLAQRVGESQRQEGYVKQIRMLLIPVLLAACGEAVASVPPPDFAGQWNHWSWFPDVTGGPCYAVGTLTTTTPQANGATTGTFDGWTMCGAELATPHGMTEVHYALTGSASPDSVWLAGGPLALRGTWTAASMNGAATLRGSPGPWNATSCLINACTAP